MICCCLLNNETCVLLYRVVDCSAIVRVIALLLLLSALSLTAGLLCLWPEKYIF